MNTYSKIAQPLGLAATSLLGAQAAGLAPAGYLPVWLLIVAWVVAGVTHMTTQPVSPAATKAAGPLALLLVALALSQACATTSTSSPPVATFEGCTTQAGQDAARGILGRVQTALATSDYVGQLAALVTQFGVDEVKCAVALAVGTLELQHAAAPGESLVAVELGRGRAWQAANP